MTDTDFRSRSLAVRSDARRMLEELRAKRIAQPRWQPTRPVRAAVPVADAALPYEPAERQLTDESAVVAPHQAITLPAVSSQALLKPAVLKKPRQKKARKPKAEKPEANAAEAITAPSEPLTVEPPQMVEILPETTAAAAVKPKRSRQPAGKAISAAALTPLDHAESAAPPTPAFIAASISPVEPASGERPITTAAPLTVALSASVKPEPMTAITEAPRVTVASEARARVTRSTRVKAKAPTASAPRKPEALSLATLPSIGPGMIWRLGQLGVVTLDDLARSDNVHLRKSLGAIGALVNVDALIAEAKSRLD